MERFQSELFAPYRFLGVVTGEVPPSVRSVFVGKKSTVSILCPFDNVVLHYNGKKLRPIGASNPLPEKITAIVSSSSCIYVAHGNTISAMPFCKDVTASTSSKSVITIMVLIGDQLVAVDRNSGIDVIDTTGFSSNLYIEGESNFNITAVVHPSTYLNKIVVGSAEGRIRIINIRTGRVIHEFERDLGSSVTVLQQTTALDVLAVGLKSGKVLLYNAKLDKILYSFCHDSSITGIAFRDDGETTMVTADRNGTIAVWSLEKQELLGKLTDVHHDAVNCLHFVSGEPIMVSAGVDNSLRLWIFDRTDGMPRELVRADGHRLGAVDVHFIGKNELLSAGEDGSVRKYDVTSLTMRQKLGSVGSSSTNLADVSHKKDGSVVEMVVGWQREAAWNNVFCRQNNDTKITTWQTRNNTQGAFILEHERFKKQVAFVGAEATTLCLSPCGNFVFIGYSTGHIDQFNAQSGRHLRSYSYKQKPKKTEITRNRNANTKSRYEDCPASKSKISSLSVDKRGKELMSTDEEGFITFWSIPTGSVVAKLSKKTVTFGLSSSNPWNSLTAVVSISESGKESVELIDTVCHRPVRSFHSVGNKVNAMTFSSDGKWLLVADNDCYIRVFDISTSRMIDVLLFSKPCTSFSFNETGEFLATVHKGERAVYVWANKAVFLSHVNIRALEDDFLPTWESRIDAPDVCIDDDDDTVLDDEIRASRETQIDENLITFSGLPSSRWANLPDLALIKERNKPTNSVKKIKQAPFFLSASATLDGFDFEAEDFEQTGNPLNNVRSKRSLLEIEGSLSSSLKTAKKEDELLKTFQSLQEKGLSYIDLQIKSLCPSTVPIFLRMLLEVLKTKKDFELVQSYLTSVMKLHRTFFWQDGANTKEFGVVLQELNAVHKTNWDELERLFTENLSIVQWVKNALL